MKRPCSLDTSTLHESCHLRKVQCSTNPLIMIAYNVISALRAFIFLPSIMRRFDDLMIVKELNAKFFAHSIIEHHLHAAITPPSVCMEFDYERLELLGTYPLLSIFYSDLACLGDAYLKYLYSSYLFVTDSAQREGALHQARLKVISNKALLANAKLAGLPQYIQARSFSYKGWKPPFFEALPDLPGTKSVTTSTEISSEQSAPEQQARQAEQDIYHKHAQEDPVASEVFAAAEDPSLNAPAIAVPSPTEAKPARKKKTRRGGLKFRGADAQSIGDKVLLRTPSHRGYVY